MMEMRTFMNKNLSFIIQNKTLSLPTAQRFFTEILCVQVLMQTAGFLKILYSHFLYRELSDPVSQKCVAQVSLCMVSLISL